MVNIRVNIQHSAVSVLRTKIFISKNSAFLIQNIICRKSPNAILKCIRDILRLAVSKLSWICIAEILMFGYLVEGFCTIYI